MNSSMNSYKQFKINGLKKAVGQKSEKLKIKIQIAIKKKET